MAMGARHEKKSTHPGSGGNVSGDDVGGIVNAEVDSRKADRRYKGGGHCPDEDSDRAALDPRA